MDLETPVTTILSNLGLDLYDLELHGGNLEIVVTKSGGVSLDEVTKANREIGEWLDANDPIPNRYTLDVSSPGLERKLRTPKHFSTTLGEVVTLRELREGAPTRRLEGVVTKVDSDSVTLNDDTVGEVQIPLKNVERARTVFKWGAEAKPSPSKGTKTAVGSAKEK
jgi:ribosome maturation factor RimP